MAKRLKRATRRPVKGRFNGIATSRLRRPKPRRAAPRSDQASAARNKKTSAGEAPIRFGIPSLDQLLGRPQPRVYWYDFTRDDESAATFGIDVSPSDASKGRESFTICLIGSDGTGKSILAMHLASRYLADRAENAAGFRVIYASTDLSSDRARTTWDNFALGFPNYRVPDPFDCSTRQDREGKVAKLPPRPKAEIEFVALKPFETKEDWREFRQREADDAMKLFFLDLASRTTGDDWGYLNRLVATLSTGEKVVPRHVLIVDTVDDLEFLVGERDAYGVVRDRRSRIAELIRTCAGKCHLVLLAGEPPDGHVPEEYIADAVIRVKFRRYGDYERRLISVEKVRGQSNIRGQHDLAIRSGIGASTGKQEHFDDPRIVRVDSPKRDPRSAEDKLAGLNERFAPSPGATPSQQSPWLFQSYVFVAPSLHYINNSIIRADGPTLNADHNRYARFGITYLDNMLAVPASKPGESDNPPGNPLGGLPTHEPAALIGEDGTHKSALSQAFLSRTLLPDSDSVIPRGKEGPPSKGVAVLITTKTIDADALIRRFNDHFPVKSKYLDSSGTIQQEVLKGYRDRVICRRLDYHHMTSNVLFHIIAQAVRAAQRMVFGGSVSKSEEERRKEGWRIRMVIDNWTSLREMYPDVRSDPLFLPCLLFYLRREGVATLIVANEDHGFSRDFNLTQNRELRDFTSVHLFTWRTPFFGESRVAITAHPPIGQEGRVDIIRELRMLKSPQRLPPMDNECLGVNPEFEMYVGLERGEPDYVPLRIYLFGGAAAAKEYFEDAKAKYGWILKTDPTADILRIEEAGTYERLRELSHLQGATRFPYTLVLQVDEYWAKSGSLHLAPMANYLTAQTAVREEKAACRNMIVEDPFDLFQPSQRQLATEDREWSRQSLFSPPGYDLRVHVAKNRKTIVKVPYTWDFGFLMCHQEHWRLAAQEVDLVSDVWQRLRTPDDKEFKKAPVTWREFVEACLKVRDVANRRGRRVSTFAIGAEIQESLSCLFLELWASEVKNGSFDKGRHEAETKEDLCQFAETHGTAFLRALCLLYELIPPRLVDVENRLIHGRESDAIPVAGRTWYSSVGEFQSGPSEDWYVPRALPGTHSCRGDWFLAIARGSRSYLMGARAIDLLCTRRANLVRLQMGVGLPVRDNNDSGPGLWTSIWAGNQPDEAIRRVTYQELTRLGGPVNPDPAAEKEAKKQESAIVGGHLSWLWRSRIKHYDRHARVLRRWLCSMLRQLQLRTQGNSGLQHWDELKKAEPKASATRELKAWFLDKQLPGLKMTLRDATIDSRSGE